MADTKISALTSLAGSDVAPATDVLPIVDTSATTTKKITVAALGQSVIVLGTEQASTSGTEIDFTGIPAGTKRITIMFVGVSTNGTSHIIVQLGDSGGFETTGYLGSGSFCGTTTGGTAFTAGLAAVTSPAAASVLRGSMQLSLEDSSDFTWVSQSVFSDTAGFTYQGAGSKATSAELTQVRITTVNGTDTFDAGVINISYQ